jgi:hypothetical protein
VSRLSVTDCDTLYKKFPAFFNNKDSAKEHWNIIVKKFHSCLIFSLVSSFLFPNWENFSLCPET